MTMRWARCSPVSACHRRARDWSRGARCSPPPRTACAWCSWPNAHLDRRSSAARAFFRSIAQMASGQRAGFSPHAQDDLAARVPLRPCFEGATRLGQGEDLLDDGPNLPRVEQCADLAQLLSVGFDDEPDEARPVVGRWFNWARADDGDQDAPWLHHLPGARQGVAAHRIEHDIHVADHLVEARRGIIDDLVGAQLAQEVAMARRGGRDDPGPGPASELDREAPYASRRAVDQRRLAR